MARLRQPSNQTRHITGSIVSLERKLYSYHSKQAQMSADKSITYSSTRGCPTQANLSFRDVVMRGLSHDRGLFVPDAFPTVTKEEVESWRSLPYHELATNVIGKFVQDDQVPRAKLAEIVEKSCAAFRSEDVTPVIDVGGHMVLVRLLVC